MTKLSSNSQGIIPLKVYDTLEASKALGVSRRAVTKLVHEGLLPTRKHFRKYVFLGEDLIRYIQKLGI